MIENLYVIIPVHNRIVFTHDCLTSLREQTVQDFDIIVIDDGSTDGTSDMIRAEFPKVILLHGDGNLWWTRAANLGVQYALRHGADYVMTLNDDTLTTKDFIEKMIFWATREPKALLGALALDRVTQEPISGGEIINWKFARQTKILDTLKPHQQYGLHEVTQFPGRGLLIPTEVFSTIGAFDAKHFPQIFADIDFTSRAYAAGYKIYCNYDARILIYRDSIGTLQYRTKKNLKNYYNYLFGIKSGANVTKFVFYAIKNCPKRYLPLCLPIGLLRRVFGYQLEWLREIWTDWLYPADSRSDPTSESMKDTTP
jgi:GT2 family glycosyltransferase